MSRKVSLMAALLLAVCASAQDTATITGTVTDPSGSAVPHAHVTLLNTGTQFTRTVETNSNGEYIAASIPTGVYTVTATAQGFQKLERSGVQLTAASTENVDLTLTVGSETQSISVVADAAIVQSESATVSNLVTTQQIADLPLVSRDFTDLVLLSPGAHAGSGTNLAEGGSPYAMRAGANFSVNGSVPQGNS
ncbi:MAG TPA: carboxypeptidase-like regulatory domain-containing protein, partial [Bryobacteraceae bacterium]|nr:carboxypeptidase-like regulatory domain-containing protein [Bryobacteraceae bacterium]